MVVRISVVVVMVPRPNPMKSEARTQALTGGEREGGKGEAVVVRGSWVGGAYADGGGDGRIRGGADGGTDGYTWRHKSYDRPHTHTSLQCERSCAWALLY